MRIVLSILVLPILFCMSPARAAEAQSLPEAIRAAPQERRLLRLHARGVQIYECRVMRDQPSAYGWAFVAPEAELFDDEGAKQCDHFAGPSWQARDGSRITGMLRGQAEAPQAGAIPWLLLTATPSSLRKEGDAGLFGRVTSVQRVNTTGGQTPRVACHEGNAGAVARVPYTADYDFLGVQ